MALDISKVTRVVNALGESAATYAKELNDRLALARATFNAIAADPAELTRIADEVSRKFRWAGAIPTRETINGAFPLPQRPARFNVIAADGSQIYPDRHGIALYYLINVGSIVFRHGLSDAPSTASLPEVFFEDEDLYYEEENSLITTEMINANRDVRELGELARLTKIEAASAPTTALLDNSLLLYISLREQNPKFSREVIEKYLAHLDVLRDSGAVVAGVVDRPRSANLIRLLNLSTLGPDEITQENLHGVGKQFKHVTDSTLFHVLKPGERSALFVLASPANIEKYEPRGHKTYFFFLNTGRPGKNAILRIEVPEWVATDSEKLNLVHAAIVEQCKASGGFPYVLMRAHELAVVTAPERRAFDEMVTGSLIRNRVPASLSQKQQGKAWTGSGRRRYR